MKMSGKAFMIKAKMMISICSLLVTIDKGSSEGQAVDAVPNGYRFLH